jgi:hypothetical protein
VTEGGRKIRQVEEEEQKVTAEIRETTIAGDVAALGTLSATAASLADAKRALSEIAIPALEAERMNGLGRVSEIQRERRDADLRASVEPAREKVRKARQDIARAFDEATDSLVLHARELWSFDEIREALAQTGRPVAPEETTRQVLTSLGIGRLAAPRPGKRIEVPIPAGILSYP